MSELSARRPSFGQQQSLVRIGGALGVAAASIALLIFTVGCFGFHAVFTGLPIIPLILSAPGMVLVILGATVKKSPGVEDTQVMGAMFVNLIGFVAALLELAIWLNWGLFYQGQQIG